MSPGAGTVAVGRLRVAGPDGLAAGRLLAAACLRPPSLPPAATLVVRRLADPRPGTLGARASLLPPPAWERAAEDALDTMAARAVRPARDAVPATADAVLFADRAELLACMAADAMDGSLAARWWWRRLAPGGAPSVVTAWLDAAPEVPAALEELAGRGLAGRFASCIPPADAVALAGRVARAFGLARPGAPPPAGRHRPPAMPGPSPAGAGRRGRPDAPGAHPSTAPPPRPWARRVPEAAGLPPAAEVLVGLGLLLRRAPADARRPGVAGVIHAWLDAGPAGPAAMRGMGAGAAATAATPAPPAPAAATARGGAAGGAHASPDRAAPEREAPAARPGRRRPSPGAAPAARTAAPPHSPAAIPPPAPRPGPAGDGAATPTRLGGVFTLLNACLALGLYGDFTQPRRPGIRLPPWDALDILGRGLLHGRGARDPLWPLLAALAGREPGVAAGRGFRPSGAWRMPPAWTAPFAQDRRPWSWHAGDRLVVRHPAGFTVADVRPDGPAGAQLARVLRRHDPPALRRLDAPAARAGSARERWAGHLVAYVRSRLARALGVRPRAVARTLLDHDAVVHVTPSRLDVVFALDQVRVEVRRAGLDRDPGWIPAGGRTVAFHFR